MVKVTTTACCFRTVDYVTQIIASHVTFGVYACTVFDLEVFDSVQVIQAIMSALLTEQDSWRRDRQNVTYS